MVPPFRTSTSLGLAFFAVFVSSAAFLAADQPSEQTDAELKKEAVARFKKINLAFWSYEDVYGQFPPAALVNKEGKSLLSWRVLLLPYLGEKSLHQEFELTEAWDSPHNKKLLARMPKAYAPVRGGDKHPHETPFQVFTGPRTIFEGEKGCRIRDITDGTTNSILFVEADRLVPWTKPEDLPYDAKKPLPKLGQTFPNIFLFALADGIVHFGRRDYDEEIMRLAIVRNDGEARPLDGILAKDQP